MIIRGENDDLPPDNSKVPILTVKNASPVYAQDVTLTWSAVPYDVATLVASNHNLDGIKFKLNGPYLTMESENNVAFRHQFSFKSKVPLNFITKSADIFIPFDIWNTAALFFIATLPTERGSHSNPYFFDLNISWNIPDGNTRAARFRLKATATNTKQVSVATKDVSASIEITTETVD